jgi:hypothetical protein
VKFVQLENHWVNPAQVCNVFEDRRAPTSGPAVGSERATVVVTAGGEIRVTLSVLEVVQKLKGAP